jgi:hypothetical protein
MLVVPGILKDNTFVPEKLLDLPDGTRARLAIDEKSIDEAMLAESQVSAVEAFVAALEAIDGELPPEFDEEIARGLKFREVDFS